MRKENKTNFHDKAIRKKTTYLQKSPSIKVWDRPFCVPLRENAQKLIWACFPMYSSHTSLGKTFSSSHATTWGTVKYIDPPFQFRKATLSQSGRVPPPYTSSPLCSWPCSWPLKVGILIWRAYYLNRTKNDTIHFKKMACLNWKLECPCPVLECLGKAPHSDPWVQSW